MRALFLTLLAIVLICCDNSQKDAPRPEEIIKAADMSYLPLIESEGTTYKYNNVPQDPITTLKEMGCNTIRIRLWYDPIGGHNGLAEVKAFSERIRESGLKVWLSVHYSDTWVDPGSQSKPTAWQALDFNALKNAVEAYTGQVMTAINPDIIQIGNETNDGMLWPEGKLSSNENQYLELVKIAARAIRSKSATAKIMLHYAGTEGSDWYFSKMGTIDYDYIGLSYYPIWHGKSLPALQAQMNTLGSKYGKKVIIAETAYPFTLGYNDATNNVVGLQSQLIPGYEASPLGQKTYLSAIKALVKQSPNGAGFCYWGAEWVAFRGASSSNGSSWENQALWDFNNNSLPAMEAFRD